MWHARGKARPQIGQFAAAKADPEGADSWEMAADHMSCGWSVSPSWKGIWTAHFQIYHHLQTMKLRPRETKHSQGYILHKPSQICLTQILPLRTPFTASPKQKHRSDCPDLQLLRHEGLKVSRGTHGKSDCVSRYPYLTSANIPATRTRVCTHMLSSWRFSHC